MAKAKSKLISDARKEAKKGRYEKAADLYKQALEADPTDYNLCITLGDTYVKLERNFDAVKSYEMAADICQREGLLVPAIAICKKITRARPNHAPAYKRLGELYGERHLLKDAIDNYSQYADLMLKENNMNEVLNAYKQVVDLAPTNVTIRTRLAELYVSQKQIDRALVEYHTLLDLYKKQGNDDKVQEIESKIRELGSTPDAAPPRPAQTEAPGASAPPPSEGPIEMDLTDLDSLNDLDNDVTIGTPSIEDSPSPDEVSEGIPVDLSGLDDLSAPEPTGETGASVPGGLADEAPAEAGGTFEIPAEDLPPTEDLETDDEPVLSIDEDLLIGGDISFEAEEEPPASTPPPVEDTPEPDAADILAEMGLFGDMATSTEDEDEEEEPYEAEEEDVVSPPMPEILDDTQPEPEEPEEPEVKPTPPPSQPAVTATKPVPPSEPAESTPTTIPEATALLEENPRNWRIYLILGDLFEQEAARSGNFDLVMNAAVVYQRGAEGYEQDEDFEGAAQGYIRWMKIAGEIDAPDAIIQSILQKLSMFAQRITNNKVNAQIYEQIALHYVNDQDLDSASAYYQKMVESAYSVMERELISNGYVGLAKVLIAKNEVETARKRLETALKFNKSHSEAAQLLMKIDMGEIGAPAPAPPVAPPATQQAPPATPLYSPPKDEGYVNVQDWFQDDSDDSEVIDIRQDAPDFLDSDSVEDIIKGFRAGLEETISEEDYAMRYDLGVAYKEMGLLDEAISEFQKATSGGDQQLKAYENIGVCFLEKNEPRFAIRQLLKGMEVRGYPDEQYIGLHYYMGRAYEELGDTQKALAEYEEVYVMDVAFKDVQERISRLSKLKDAGAKPASPAPSPPTGKKTSPDVGAGAPTPATVPPASAPRRFQPPGMKGAPTPKPVGPRTPAKPPAVDDTTETKNSFFDEDDLDIPALDGIAGDKDDADKSKRPSKKKNDRDKRISFL
ncbi:MAG: hypothetical protein D6675_13050 [Gemmatimonadetes bacterium]|nr:MAG: hypothetical protein D6675_13050 [Gemmatimonadota bacterium]